MQHPVAAPTTQGKKHPTQPELRPTGDGHFELTAPYRYQWLHKGAARMITVPEGFTFDMASVPRVAWPLISPFDLGPAAVIHDWTYYKKGHFDNGSFGMASSASGRFRPLTKDPEHVWTRKDADRLFGRMMRESEVPKWRRRSAYWAVRLFGGGAWRD